MEFRIADTFTDSLNRLSGQEQKAVKTTAFDLQLNPVHPSMQFHKLDRAKDPDFWSVRVSRDIRLIVHKTASSLLLCYVDHQTSPTSGPNGARSNAIPEPARRHPQLNMLLTTFSHALADALRVRLERLVGNEPLIRGRIRVRAINDLGKELYTNAFGTPGLAEDALIRSLIQQTSDAVGGHGFSRLFLLDQWRTVVDAWQLRTWEAYRGAAPCLPPLRM